MSKRTMRTESKSNSITNVTTNIRNFELTMDQPEDSGGTDEGPTPVEYALASLGSCICTMVNMVARKMDLEVDSVKTTVEGDLDHVGVVDPEKIRPGLLDVRLEVSIEGELTKAEKEKLIKHAENKCPVTDSLKKPVDVSFRLSE